MSRQKWLTNHKKVISLVPQKSEWEFYDFGNEAGRSALEAWWSGLSDDARDIFNAILKNNKKIESPREWTQLRYLHGDARKHRIWELRFRADKRAYRVLGMFGTKKKSAVLLIGCFHKQSVYDPPNAIDTAISRKRLLEEGRANAVERKIRSDI